MPHNNDLKFEEEIDDEEELEIKPDGFLEQEEATQPIIIPEHFHTADKIDFRDILKKKIYIHHTIVGTTAATAANYAVFWIAPFECVVSEIREVHQTAGSSADAALQIEKLTGTQALDGGVTLNTAIELDGTADTVVTPVLTTTVGDLNLSRGNRLAMKDAGTLTAVANVTVVIEITIL